MEYVDSIVLRLRGTDLDDIVGELTETRSRSTKAVNTLSKKRRVRGFKFGNVVYELSIKAEQIDVPGLPSWDQLLDSKEKFDLVKVPNAGRPVTFSGCVVSSIEDTNSDGDSGRAIKVMPTDRKVG